MTDYNAKKGITECKVLVLIGTISLALAVHTTMILAQEVALTAKERGSDFTVTRYATAQLVKSLPSLDEGALVKPGLSWRA